MVHLKIMSIEEEKTLVEYLKGVYSCTIKVFLHPIKQVK